MKTLSFKSLPVVASLPAPTGALEGVMVELSSDKKAYYCDGVMWSLASVRVTVSSTTPTTPVVGDIWIDTN